MKPFLYIDASGGASADMLLAGLLDLGLPAQGLEHAVRRVVSGTARVRGERVERDGIRGLRLGLRVRLRRPLPRVAGEVVGRVEGSGLQAGLRKRIARVWRVLAAAEGRVHGVGWRRVRFRQVGEVDTWVCFAGFCAGLAHFRARQLFVGPVRLGSFHRDHDGRARREPGPATAHLLKGFRVARTGDAFEWTTPTGAALLAAFGSPAAPPVFRVLRIGHGFGHLNPPAGCGVVRVILGELIDSR